MKTKVIFLYNEENDDLFAFFPEEIHNGETKTAYSHIGQHSSCSLDHVAESREATFCEALELYKELTDLVGYDLEVCEKSSIFTLN